MGDGIDRALARASELEIMVHNEVSLLDDLFRERAAHPLDRRGPDLAARGDVNNADRVRSAIVVAHEDLTLALGTGPGACRARFPRPARR